MTTPPPYSSRYTTNLYAHPQMSTSHPTHPTHGPSPSRTFPISHPPSFDPPPPVPTNTPPSARADDSSFDIFVWHPKYASCQRYFLDHAQHSGPVQAVCAFLNIHLPYQRTPPTPSSTVIPHPQSPSVRGGPSSSSSSHNAQPPGSAPFQPAPSISLTPYLRRLVVTGLDFPGVLHGFFGDDWAAGIGPLHEQERRNYMFAAKSGGWGSVKNAYDMPPLETVPFLRPLQGVVEQELVAAEKSWSEFMAFEDWMIGPRALKTEGEEGREREESLEPAVLSR